MSTRIGQTVRVGSHRYCFVEQIGHGSYGSVYKAVDETTHEIIAIKVIKKERIRKEQERQSIRKEIRTMRVAMEQFENGHPNIVRLIGTKESDNSIYIVLEYCAGGDIATLMKKNGRMAEEQARNLLLQLASGLQFLRSQCVIHRDLKPANLLLSTGDFETARLKIADFGFARELPSETLAESVVGTPLYMAPELLDGKSYDAKADLWSVGIILYEMLVNSHPFLKVKGRHAGNYMSLRANVAEYFRLYKKVLLSEDLNLSRECVELVEGLLRPDPTQRISFEQFFNAPFLLPPRPEPSGDNEYGVGAIDTLGNPSNGMSATSSSYNNNDNNNDNTNHFTMDGVGGMHDSPMGSTMVNVDPFPGLDEEFLPRPGSPLPALEEISESLRESEEYVFVDGAAVVATLDAETKAAEERNEVDTTRSLGGVDNDELSEEPIQVSNRQTRRRATEPGISYRCFYPGAIALFVPTPAGDFLAFHEYRPHYYLTKESIRIATKGSKPPPYVLGTIVMIDDHIATEDCNPYNLRISTLYHSVTVETLSNGRDGYDFSNRGMTGPSLLTNRKPPPGAPPNERKIVFRSFEVNDTALFFQTPTNCQFVAFNEGCPHYYLSEESIEAYRDKNGCVPAYVCGQIIMIDEHVADQEENPFHLHYGTPYYIATVAHPDSS